MTSSAPQEFRQTLERARAGDELAWQTLFRLVSGRVVGFLVSRGAPDPEGVAGDTFLDVVRSIRRFDGDERDFIAWTVTIARRRMIDARRRSGRRRETTAAPDDLESVDREDVEEIVLGLEGASRARLLLDRLTPDQRDVLTLRIYGEMTLAEIGDHLGKPVTAVTSLQHRALASLRRMLGDQPETGRETAG